MDFRPPPCASSRPISGEWLVRVDGWQFPELPLLYPSLEAAQRAADDVLINLPVARLPATRLW